MFDYNILKFLNSFFPDIISWIIISLLYIFMLIIITHVLMSIYKFIYYVIKSIFELIFNNLIISALILYLIFMFLEAIYTETVYCGKHDIKTDNYTLSLNHKAIDDSHFINFLVSDKSSSFKCSDIRLEEISETKFQNWQAANETKNQLAKEKKEQLAKSSNVTTPSSEVHILDTLSNSIAEWNKKRKIKKFQKEWNKNSKKRRINDLEDQVNDLENQLNNNEYYDDEFLLLNDSDGNPRNCIRSGDIINCI
jgi:hypothetical protein